MADQRVHLERPDWYDEAGAWRDRLPQSRRERDDTKPEVRVTVRNVANDGP